MVSSPDQALSPKHSTKSRSNSSGRRNHESSKHLVHSGSKTFHDMKQEYQRKGTVYGSELQKINSLKGFDQQSQNSPNQYQVTSKQSLLLNDNVVEHEGSQETDPPENTNQYLSYNKLNVTTQSPPDTRKEINPYFQFQSDTSMPTQQPQSTKGRDQSQSLLQNKHSRSSELLKTLSKCNQSELKKILISTIDAAAEQKWHSNNSGLKIQGQNMGFPMPDLSYQIKEYVMKTLEEERERELARQNMQNEATLTEVQNNESQIALNADLMLNNIYQTSEFIESAQKIQEVIDEKEGRQTRTLQHILDSPSVKDKIKEDKDEYSQDNDGRDQTSMNTKHAQVGVNAMTPTPELSMPKKNTLNQHSSGSIIASQERPGEKSKVSKAQDIFQNHKTIVGELDVETNYLRSSAQIFGDELPLKTVFQKRGPAPSTLE